MVPAAMDPWKMRSLLEVHSTATCGVGKPVQTVQPLATRVSKTGLGLTEDGLKASVLEEMPLAPKIGGINWFGGQMVCEPAGWVFSHLVMTCI